MLKKEDVPLVGALLAIAFAFFLCWIVPTPSEIEEYSGKNCADHECREAAYTGAVAFYTELLVMFTAVLAAHLFGLARRVRIALWVLFVLTTTATVYLGWHYVVDDLAGMVIAVIALGLACALTGFQPRFAWRPVRWRPGIARPRGPAAESDAA